MREFALPVSPSAPALNFQRRPQNWRRVGAASPNPQAPFPTFNHPLKATPMNHHEELDTLKSQALRAATRKGFRRFSKRSTMAQILARMRNILNAMQAAELLCTDAITAFPQSQDGTSPRFSNVKICLLSDSDLLKALDPGSSQLFLLIDPFPERGFVGRAKRFVNFGLSFLLGSDWLVSRECCKAVDAIFKFDAEARELHGLPLPPGLRALVEQAELASATTAPASGAKARKTL